MVQMLGRDTTLTGRSPSGMPFCVKTPTFSSAKDITVFGWESEQNDFPLNTTMS